MLIFLLVAELNSSTYWKAPFRALCTSKKLIEFIVMDISEAEVKRFKGQGHISTKASSTSTSYFAVGRS